MLCKPHTAIRIDHPRVQRKRVSATEVSVERKAGLLVRSVKKDVSPITQAAERPGCHTRTELKIRWMAAKTVDRPHAAWSRKCLKGWRGGRVSIDLQG